MNRRWFVGRGIGALTAVVLFPTDVFRYATGQLPRETPITRGNRSVFYPLWDNWGIKSSDVKARIINSELTKEQWLEMDDKILELSRSLDDSESVAERLGCYPGYYPVGIDDGGANMRRVNRILAANPETTREQAFFDAVVEAAEAVP